VDVRSGAFPATEYNDVLSGYQRSQVVELWKKQRFEDHLCPRPQGADAVFSPFNHLTRLIARENFINLSGCYGIERFINGRIKPAIIGVVLTYFMVQDIIWKADCHSAYEKISCFLYGTRRFITVFTKARHWTLSWASWIQFAPSIPISLRSNLMLSSHPCLGLPNGLLPSGLPTKTP
jgi:hypothetical protein